MFGSGVQNFRNNLTCVFVSVLVLLLIDLHLVSVELHGYCTGKCFLLMFRVEKPPPCATRRTRTKAKGNVKKKKDK